MARSVPQVTDVADLVEAVARRIRREARRDLEPLGITWAQLRALRAVARLGDGARMSDLADALHVARRSATSLVDELEARGLVARLADPVDRRSVQVNLRPEGRDLLAELTRRRGEAAARVLGPLGPADRRALHDLLAPLAEPAR